MSLKCLLVAMCLVLMATTHRARAVIVQYSFQATLTDGSFAGLTFPGAISYDTSNPLSNLSSIDFTLLSRHFTIADLFAGGQAVTNNGSLTYFTAAFEVLTSPVPFTTIAFGFGGPGSVGYVTSSPYAGGDGRYVLAGPVSVTAPPDWAFAFLFPVAFFMRRRTASTPEPCHQNSAPQQGMSVPEASFSSQSRLAMRYR